MFWKTPHAIFWGVGVFLIVVAVLVRLVPSAPSWLFDVSMNVGISVFAVSLVDWLWRQVGGDPIIRAIEHLHHATTLLRDLDGTGVRRVYKRRVDWGEAEGKGHFLRKMRDARRVDLMGIALQRDWANDPQFKSLLRSRSRRDRCHFRILIFDPESATARQRAREEVWETGGVEGRMLKVVESSLKEFYRIRCLLPETDQEFLELRAIRDTNIYCSILRVDDELLVAEYLYHCRGTRAPCFHIAGEGTAFFEIYTEEFERMWQRAATWPPPVGGAVG